MRDAEDHRTLKPTRSDRSLLAELADASRRLADFAADSDLYAEHPLAVDNVREALSHIADTHKTPQDSTTAVASVPRVARVSDRHAVKGLVSPTRTVDLEPLSPAVWGPYDVDGDMTDVPLPVAVTELYAAGLVQPGDPGRIVASTMLAHLEAACEAVRIGRGSFDQLVLELLSRAEVGVAMVVIGLLRRAYAAGEAAAIAELADTPLHIEVAREIPNELDDSLSEPGRPVYAPCRPIGCDAGHHLTGCVYTETDETSHCSTSYCPNCVGRCERQHGPCETNGRCAEDVQETCRG